VEKVNKNTNICPSCKVNPLHENEVMNPLSRKDNDTYICNECGQKEALEEYLKLINE
jgi:RNA polymerase subunit RPABC4/transcription elongation factor Spt4